MIKKVVLCSAIILSLMASTVAFAEGNLTNFRQQKTYSATTFQDVYSSDWYYSATKSAFELGLMGGKDQGIFDPKGNLTLAEAVAIASRVHEVYNGGDGIIPSAGTKWYDGSVVYAIENGIIKSTDFVDYTKLATRAQMAYIFSSPLESKDMTAINNITVLPDVTTSTAYSKYIFSLYNAGIVGGSDAKGTFKPDSNITRAETVVILKNLVLKSDRKVLSLESTAPAPTTPPISRYDAAQVAKGVTPLYGMHSYGSQNQKEYDFVMNKIAEAKKIHNVETYNFANDRAWQTYYAVKSGGGTELDKMWIKQWAYVNVINEFGEQKAKELYIIMGLTGRLITGALTNVGESAYEQLTTGADCNGRAHLESAVWDSYGYSTRILAGNSHAWTQIKLSDGKWHDGSGLNVGNQTTSTKHTDVAFVLVQPTY